MDVEAMRFHYSHTLEEWYRRTVLHQREITDLYDERFFRMWQYYLAGAEQAFRNGKMVNWQMIYVKDRNSHPDDPRLDRRGERAVAGERCGAGVAPRSGSAGGGGVGSYAILIGIVSPELRKANAECVRGKLQWADAR